MWIQRHPRRFSKKIYYTFHLVCLCALNFILKFKFQLVCLREVFVVCLWDWNLYFCNLFSFFGLESTDNLQSLIEKDIFGAMQIPIFYIIKCKFFLKNSAKLHSIWIDCSTAVEKQTWEHEFIYNIALLHTL